MLIEIYIDLICPWCLIGKRRLERALAQRPGARVELRWPSFQLNPDMPPGGMDRKAYLQGKFGGPTRAAQVIRMIDMTARQEGLEMNWAGIRRTPNTVDAHRLVRLAEDHGRGSALVEALFRAYFQQGLDIGDRAVLVQLAASAGLSAEAARQYLAGNGGLAAIRNDELLARQLTVQVVPYYIFDRRYGFAGAQESDAFLPLLDMAAEASALGG